MKTYRTIVILSLLIIFSITITQAQPVMLRPRNCLTSQEAQMVKEGKDCDSRSATAYVAASQQDNLSIKLAGQALLRCANEFHEFARQSTNTNLRKFFRDMGYNFEPLGELMLSIHALNSASEANNLAIVTDLVQTISTSEARGLLSSITSTVMLQQRIAQAKQAARRIHPEFLRVQNVSIDYFTSQKFDVCN